MSVPVSKGGADNEDDYETDSDIECEDEDAFGDSITDEMELYEMRSENMLQVVQPGFVIALFSPTNALELCYLLLLNLDLLLAMI